MQQQQIMENNITKKKDKTDEQTIRNTRNGTKQYIQNNITTTNNTKSTRTAGKRGGGHTYI